MAIPFETDAGSGQRARLGVVVLQSDETIEPELARIAAQLTGVALHHSRIQSGAQVTTQTLRAMHSRLADSVMLFPQGAPFDVIGYGCTSGATVIGEQAVSDAITSVLPGVTVTNPLTALKAACRSMGVRRLGLITPYERSVTDALNRHLQESGLSISSIQSFEQTSEAIVARITPTSILAALKNIPPNDPCDAWFVSCTNLRMASITDAAELHMGKPVFSSNQVLAWHMLRRAGLNDALSDWGQLFKNH